MPKPTIHAKQNTTLVKWLMNRCHGPVGTEGHGVVRSTKSCTATEDLQVELLRRQDPPVPIPDQLHDHRLVLAVAVSPVGSEPSRLRRQCKLEPRSASYIFRPRRVARDAGLHGFGRVGSDATRDRIPPATASEAEGGPLSPADLVGAINSSMQQAPK